MENQIAFRWQRLLADLFDLALMIAITTLLAFLLAEPILYAIGYWGRFIGFGMGLAYFGLGSSGMMQGQTLGKQLLKIKVVNRHGEYLPMSRGLLRGALIAVIILGTNWQIMGSLEFRVAFRNMLFALHLAGLMSIVYTYTFNRATLQTPYDLLVGSYVVPVTDAPFTPPAISHFNLRAMIIIPLLVIALLTLDTVTSLRNLSHAAEKANVAAISTTISREHEGAVHVFVDYFTDVNALWIWVVQSSQCGDACRQDAEVITTLVLNQYTNLTVVDEISITLSVGDLGFNNILGNPLQNWIFTPDNWCAEPTSEPEIWCGKMLDQDTPESISG